MSNKAREIEGEIDPELTCVKVVTVWKSGTNEVLGYFSGIFGPIYPAGTMSFLSPALRNANPFVENPTGLHSSPEEAMRAWEKAKPVEMQNGMAESLKIPEKVWKKINENGMYRAL